MRKKSGTEVLGEDADCIARLFLFEQQNEEKYKFISGKGLLAL
jgi:hypothetical protein